MINNVTCCHRYPGTLSLMSSHIALNLPTLKFNFHVNYDVLLLTFDS